MAGVLPGGEGLTPDLMCILPRFPCRPARPRVRTPLSCGPSVPPLSSPSPRVSCHSTVPFLVDYKRLWSPPDLRVFFGRLVRRLHLELRRDAVAAAEAAASLDAESPLVLVDASGRPVESSAALARYGAIGGPLFLIRRGARRPPAP